MRQMFVALAVGIPLALSVFIVVNSVTSDTFPLLSSDLMDESQYMQQTYRAALDYCKNNYGNIGALGEEGYAKCIDLVETWYAENP